MTDNMGLDMMYAKSVTWIRNWKLLRDWFHHLIYVVAIERNRPNSIEVAQILCGCFKVGLERGFIQHMLSWQQRCETVQIMIACYLINQSTAERKVMVWVKVIKLKS